MRGTGPWICRKLMPTSKRSDQSAADVTSPRVAPPECTVALVEQHDVLLDLPADVEQGWFGQGRGLSVGEGLLEIEGNVAPSPDVTVTVERERPRVCLGEHPHEGDHRVPLRDVHVRQRLESVGGVGGEHASAVGEFVDVEAVDVDRMLTPPTAGGGLGAGARRFDIRTVPVDVARKRKREPRDTFR